MSFNQPLYFDDFLDFDDSSEDLGDYDYSQYNHDSYMDITD